MRQKWVLAAAAVATVLLSVLVYWRYAPASTLIAQARKNIPVRVFGLGTVEARILSKVGFEVGASLVELSADHGDRVSRGAVLARLDATQQEAKLARAKAATLSAEASLKKAEASATKADAVFQQKQVTNRRKRNLLDRQVISDQTAEEALRDEAVAKADLELARAEIEVAKSQLTDANANLAYETTQLEHHVLRAPYDALVIQRHVETGTVVKAGDPIFTVIAPETVWALAHIDESRAGAIQEGQHVEVRLRSLPSLTFQGRVARIGIESDRVTEERRVWVKCEVCPPRFFLGEQAEVFIKVAQLDSALLVPDSAVRSFDGRTALAWTIENGRLAERRVAIGHRTEDSLLEITGGLPAGASIAIGVPNQAKLGRLMRVRTERLP